MKSAAWMALVAVAAVATAAVITRRKTQQRFQAMEQEVLDARAGVQRKEKQRQDERRGRVSAEKELRRVMGEKLDTSNGQYVQSLGHVESCFRGCVGTPRQGLFAPATRGKIVFCRSISPEMLDGLEQFSHVWVMFVFHKNTNGKNVRAHEGLRSDSHRFTFKAKISPPRLKEKVGIFSTRSPHRPNPIGITLAKIEGVDARKRTVHLSALDLVEGTPVVDIKPYVPAYDSIPTARAAAWISSDLSPTLQDMRWKDPLSLAALERIAATSSFYRDDAVALRSMIEQVLLADVRSKYQTKRRQHIDATWVTLDNARVQYRVVSSSEADAGGDWIEILVRQDAQNESTVEEMPSRHEPEEIGAALALVSVAKETTSDDATAKANAGGSSSPGVRGEERALAVDADVTENDTGEAESMDVKAVTETETETETPAVVKPKEEAPAAPAKVMTDAPAVLTSASTAAVAAALAVAVPEGKTSRPQTPTSAKSKKAENALGIPTSKKKKTKKKKPEALHPCVGLCIDALDKNRNWGNARILEVDVANEKIKITFPGFSKNWDLWTDLLSIAPHGAEASPPKGLSSKSWDGLTDLFTGQRIAGADPNASPEIQIKQELNIAPSKPLRVKKGYKLEIIPESEADTAALKQSSKRKLPAARESPVANDLEASVQTTPSNAKRPRVVKIASGPSPKTAASPINAPLSDPELVRQRNENSATTDQSAAFLSRCVDVWKKQLLSLLEPQREALLSDETPAYVDL